MDAPDDSVDDDAFETALDDAGLRPDDGRWGWSIGRIVSVALVLAMAVFWIWAFLWSPRGHPDELDDPAFPELAERRCTRALEELATVPSAREATGLDDRAQQIEATTGMLAAMVADLRGSAPAEGTRDGDLVKRWLSDWDVYIGDRYTYADRFRQGVDTAFEVTAIGGDQVTSALDLFATINRMPSCASPGDV